MNRIHTIMVGLLAVPVLLGSCVDAKDPYSPNNPDQGRMGKMSVGTLDRQGDFIVVEPDGSTKAEGAAVPDVETFRLAGKTARPE